MADTIVRRCEGSAALRRPATPGEHSLPKRRSTLRLVAAAAAAAFALVSGCSGGGIFPYAPGAHMMNAQALDHLVSAQSRAAGVPAPLLRAVINRESGGDPSAISGAGAMGLMQLMPGTAGAYGVSNPFDPQQNVGAGAAYLSVLIKRYHGDVRLALAAYNAGEGAVAKYGGVPPFAETRAYVDGVLFEYRAAHK